MQTQIDIPHAGADPGIPAAAITSTSLYALLAGAVQAGIDLLDSLEASQEDLEGDEPEGPDVDLEPSLGATEAFKQDRAWAIGDLSGDGGENEPSLAAPERHPRIGWSGGGIYTSRDVYDDQRLWAAGVQNDCEAVNEDGGSILDEPHDEDTDSEPSLGWTLDGVLGCSSDREGDPAEWGIADGDALSIEHAEAGGETPCLDQSVETGGAYAALLREQAAMRETATRLSAIVARVRSATDTPRPGAGQMFAEALAN
jgi:hypothetical protein